MLYEEYTGVISPYLIITKGQRITELQAETDLTSEVFRGVS